MPFKTEVPELVGTAPILMFEYKGKNVEIPIATSLSNLKEFIHEKTLPMLPKHLKIGLEGGIGISPYTVPSFDNFEVQFPGAASRLIDALEQAGLESKPTKIDNYRPTRFHMLQYLEQSPDNYIDINYIRESTFIIGVLFADKPQTNYKYPCVDVSEELKATSVNFDSCIAVEGPLILECIQTAGWVRAHNQFSISAIS